jgi:hypothetical protein
MVLLKIVLFPVVLYWDKVSALRSLFCILSVAELMEWITTGALVTALLS